MKEFGPNMGPVGVSALNYLYGRGITAKHIRRYGLSYSDEKICPVCQGGGYEREKALCRFCGASSINPFYKRIIIPTFENRKLVYFQGRSTKEDDSFRYMNPRSATASGPLLPRSDQGR